MMFVCAFGVLFVGVGELNHCVNATAHALCMQFVALLVGLVSGCILPRHVMHGCLTFFCSAVCLRRVFGTADFPNNIAQLLVIHRTLTWHLIDV